MAKENSAGNFMLKG